MPKQPARPARLTRKNMEDLINSGQSVIHEGQMITTVEGLPTEVDLALGDPAKEATTAADIDRQIKALESQKAKLKTAQKVEPAKEGADPKAPDDGKQPEEPGSEPKSPDDKASTRAKILGQK